MSMPVNIRQLMCIVWKRQSFSFFFKGGRGLGNSFRMTFPGTSSALNHLVGFIAIFALLVAQMSRAALISAGVYLA